MEKSNSENDILDTVNDIEVQYIISLNRFIILSILSAGLYSIWWVYASWRFFKQKEKSDIMPVARTIFFIIFGISLFQKIQQFANEKGYKQSYSPVSLFILCIISEIATEFIPDPYWIIGILSFVFLIPPFNALNFAKQHSTEFTVKEQTSFTTEQIVLVIIGLLLTGLILSGTLNHT